MPVLFEKLICDECGGALDIEGKCLECGEKTMNGTITKEQYLQLVGLKTLADINSRKNEEIMSAIATILDEESPNYSSDLTWDTGSTVDEKLAHMKISVEEAA